MDGSYVCRICGDVFPDGSRSNRSSKMKAHLNQTHPELVLKVSFVVLLPWAIPHLS